MTHLPDTHTTDQPDWVADAVFYQIFPDRFANGDPQHEPGATQPWGALPDRQGFQGGDLAGIIDRLDYLTDLGVTGLWLNPIFAAGTNHRYDAHDYLRIDPRLGDATQLKELVREAHARGIRVILDGVFNHCGDGFWAFQDLLANGETSTYRDWFHVRRFPIQTDPPSYQTCGGASYLPKLNTDNPDTRRYLIEVATRWIEDADIDGWRLDVPWKAPHPFWQELRTAVRQVRPDAYLVGEIWRDPAPWLDVFDGVMNYRLRDILLDFCLFDAMDAEDAAFEIDALLAACGPAAPFMLNLLGSHDTPRILTLAGGDIGRVRCAQVAMFTLPGVPMIYYGDELGLEGDNDPGCRGAMPSDAADWQPPEGDLTRPLIEMRHAHPSLRRGDYTKLLTFNGVFAYRRRLDHDDVVVVLNPRNAQYDLCIPLLHATSEAWRDELTGTTYASGPGGIVIEHLPATSALILTPEPRAR